MELLNDQKRRMKQLEHKKEIDRLVALKREQREMDRQKEISMDREQDEISLLRRQIIEQERQRMLREQAGDLVGFLPQVSFHCSQCRSLVREFCETNGIWNCLTRNLKRNSRKRLLKKKAKLVIFKKVLLLFAVLIVK